MDRDVLARAVSYIDSWLSFRYSKLEMPGFVVAVAHEGELVLNRAYGLANLETGQTMTADHVFRIASHSKTFTATAAMQLVEKQLLDLDSPVSAYLPWLSNHSDRRIKQITARQLLSHGAGVIRDGYDCNFWQLAYPFPDRDEFQQRFLGSQLIFDSNQQMKYSNFGFTLLGQLIENITGVGFNQYAKDNILTPLGLNDTGPEISDAVIPRLVKGYGRRDTRKRRVLFPESIDTRAMSPATGFYSTSTDLCKYFSAHFQTSGELLSQHSKAEMQKTHFRVKNTKDNEEYGLGFAIDYAYGRKLFGHGGSFPGHRTKTMCDGAAQLVISVLTNCVDGEARTIGKGIFSIIDHFEKSQRDINPDNIQCLRRLQGRFVNLWSDIDIVEYGVHLVGVDPNSWFPFSADQDVQRLDLVDASTLKITNAHAYGSEGEEIIFDFADDRIKSILYAGSRMWPASDYNSRVEQTENAPDIQEPAQAPVA